jgi:16S rRNA G1207 methylase RsmC
VTEDEHYFTADPSVPFERFPLTAEVWGSSYDLVSGSGVFARGRVDIGTSVLFKETEPPALPDGARVLDVGCGYGVIGLVLASLLPAVEVVGIDVNERAILLANENAQRLGLTNYRAVVPSKAQGEWDEIWSNPPIRIGKDALHELLLTWLPRLTSEGRAVMVVGKNLGADSLQRWLADQGFPTERTGSAKGFRVLETTRGH